MLKAPFIVFAALLCSCASTPAPPAVSQADVSAEIIALERAALDRWGNGDPQGYLSTYAPDITYFDPAVTQRLDGIDAMKAYYAPLTGKVKVASYDMIAPKVQRVGDIAILTFQLVSFGPEKQVLARWNSTEVYHQSAAGWRILHNHWSNIQPQLKTKPGE